ncbi:MAG: type II toxin-antitoxin system PemK/MazF family toxin [Pelobium sp.]
MIKGNIVLIVFPFSHLSGSKLRPAVIIATTPLDLTVCFITTQLQWKESSDIEITPTIQNGLKIQSLIRTSKIATLDKKLAKGILGELDALTVSKLNKNLKSVLAL